MSVPRLVEVLIHVSELDEAVAAWRRSFGFESQTSSHAAIFTADDVAIRLVESADSEHLGLTLITLSLPDGRSDAAFSASSVPIRLIQAANE